MAVKPEKIKERLRILFPKANLSQKRIDEISAKLAKKPADDAEDDAIDLVINDANDFMDFEALAKEDDRVRTLESLAKKAQETPPNPKPTTEDPEPPKPKDGDDAPAWAKVLIQKVEAIEKGEVVKSKQSSIQTAFEKSDVLKNLKPHIKESWLKRIAVTDDLTDEQIAEQITAFETEYQELTQTAADNESYSGAAPNGGQNANISDKEIESIVDSL